MSCDGYVLTESRGELVVGEAVAHADRFGERQAAIRMLASGSLKASHDGRR